MLQAPFPVNAARAGDLRAVTAWRQRCATTEANPVDARFPFDEWRPLQLACAEGDAAAVETILAAGAAVDAADLSRIAPCSTGLQVAARYGHAEVCAALVAAEEMASHTVTATIRTSTPTDGIQHVGHVINWPDCVLATMPAVARVNERQ